jgi:hypothetical protein
MPVSEVEIFLVKTLTATLFVAFLAATFLEEPFRLPPYTGADTLDLETFLAGVLPIEGTVAGLLAFYFAFLLDII